MTSKRRRKQRGITIWLERGLALIAAFNLVLVLFDLSYVPWRNFWLQRTLKLGEWVSLPLPLPDVTPLYDPIKGIEPHRDTQAYLDRLQVLEASLKRDPNSTEVQVILDDLASRSDRLVDENPFQGANKTGTLEKIKTLMRDHVRRSQGVDLDSSKEAFRRFWAPGNFRGGHWDPELRFFQSEIAPLIQTNYYRRIGQNGDPFEGFWQIDVPFQILFALEILGRTYRIKRRYPSLSWREALLWRWTDLLLLLPVWRWLRVLPVTLRLQAAGLLDLEPVRNQLSRGFVALLAGELLEVMVLQTVNQVQASLTKGNLLKGLIQSGATPYVDLNNTNEVEAIARKLAQIVVYKVLPAIKPDLEALLHYNVQQSLGQLPLYQAAQKLPGFMTLPNQITQQVIGGFTQALTVASQQTYSALTPPTPEASALTEQVTQHFMTALSAALQDQDTIGEIQGLIADFLEEFKINYVQRISEANFEAVLEEAQTLSAQRSGN